MRGPAVGRTQGNPMPLKDAPLSHPLPCRPVFLLIVACALPPASAVPLPSEWKEWRGIHYRVEADGNFSCYSENGRNCRRGLPALDSTRARPLVCGAAHRAVWPSTGYERPGHWCNVAYANLFAVWHDYALLGHRGQLSKNARGDTMCHSFDGVSCHLRGPSNADLPAGVEPSPAPSTAEIRPLVCGAALKQRQGISGYDDPAHWCNLPEIVARWVNPPPTDGAHGPVGNGEDTGVGWTYKDTKLPLPALTVDEKPMWIAKIRTWAYHDYASIDISRDDDILMSVTLRGMGHRSEPAGANPDTVLHLGGATDALTPGEYKLKRFDEYGLSRHVFSFEVQDKGRALFKRKFQMLIPIASNSSGPWLPEHEEFTVNLPADWGRSAAGSKEPAFRLYVDNGSHPTDRSSLTEIEELVVARRRVRPAD